MVSLRLWLMGEAEGGYRAGAVVLPSPSKDPRDIAMQIGSLRYYWALAHQDPTSGVQVRGFIVRFEPWS